MTGGLTLEVCKKLNRSEGTRRSVNVILGGTNGLGKAIAEKLAEYTQESSTFVIIGRNEDAAKRVIEKIQSHGIEHDCRFEAVDCASFKQVRDLGRRLSSDPLLSKINKLVVTPGFLSMSLDPSEDGIDKKVQCHYFSRMLLMDCLKSNIQAAAEAGECSRVLSVLDPTRGGKINWNDIALKQPANFSLGAAATHCITLTNLYLAKMSKLHTKTSFIHAYPGIVDTGVARQMPWYIKPAASVLFKLVGAAPEDVADYLIRPLYSQEGATGLHLIDNHAREVKAKGDISVEQEDLAYSRTQDIWQ